MFTTSSHLWAHRLCLSSWFISPISKSIMVLFPLTIALLFQSTYRHPQLCLHLCKYFCDGLIQFHLILISSMRDRTGYTGRILSHQNRDFCMGESGSIGSGNLQWLNAASSQPHLTRFPQDSYPPFLYIIYCELMKFWFDLGDYSLHPICSL